MTIREKHAAVFGYLKKRFPNLSADEANKIAWDLIELIGEGL